MPPDSSGTSESSDKEWEPGGSEYVSQCPDTNVSNHADKNDAAPRLSDLGGSSDLQENADCACYQGPDANGTNPADENDVAHDLFSHQEDADMDFDQTYGGLLADLFCQQRDPCNWITNLCWCVHVCVG